MKNLLLITLISSTFSAFAQSQITTTGNNLVDPSNPRAADIVIGSDAGSRHDASIMWWSSASASRISNTADAFKFSVWNTTNANISLAATVGQPSFFQGTVGIGTTSFPTNGKLQVNGPIDNLSVDGSGAFRVYNAASFSGGIGTDAWAGNGNNLDFSTYAAQNLYSYAGGQKRMVILSSGNVGIGTTNPDEKLTIYGTVHARAVKVDLNGPLADFVFSKNYRLTPLREVNDYINKHQRLSEMPSADEAAANGLNLGDMNQKILQKVEELTRYLIEEHEINLHQQRKISELNNKVHMLLKNNHQKINRR